MTLPSHPRGRGSREAEQADLLALPEMQTHHARHTGYKADEPQAVAHSPQRVRETRRIHVRWRGLPSLTDTALTMVRANAVGHLERRGREGY
jgi:hypothetical protein